MQRLGYRVRLLLIFLALFLLTPSQFAVGTRSNQLPSRGTLKQRLKKVNRNIKSVQNHLRQVKSRERNVSGQLTATQRRLEKSQDRVTSNKLNLMQAQSKLKIISDRLVRTQRQLDRRKQLLSRRLVDIYKGEDLGYIDVLLGSRDMRTYLSRGYYVRRIVTSDVDLINEVNAMKRQIEQDKRDQAAEVRRIASLQTQLVQERDEVANLADEKENELTAIENDRELYEGMLSEFRAQSQQIENEIQRLQATPSGQKRYQRRFAGGLSMPVNGHITSRFGYRTHPITRVRSLHTGVDIACPSGTSVHAAADGEVIMSSWMGAYGYAVVIDHGGGVSTLYGHNSKLLARVGRQVKRGDVIAKSGSTGWSTGPHCHFEKRVNGKPVNPM